MGNTEKTWVLRVYDKTNPDALKGENHYMILADGIEMDEDWYWKYDYTDPKDHMAREEIISLVTTIASMQWQEYTSYVIGTISSDDIKKGKIYSSEIANYELDEIVIDSALVEHLEKYKRPYTY